MNFQIYGGEQYDRLIKPVMMTGKIIAIWPLPVDSSRSRILLRRFHLFCMFFLVGVTSIGQTADVIYHLSDLNQATECALTCTVFYLCIIRLVVYTAHQKDMLYVVNAMREDWTLTSYEDRMILSEKTMLAYRLAKFFITTVVISVVLFMFVPLLEIYVAGNDKVLPFRGYFYINHTVSPIFECFYLFNVAAGGFAGSIIAGATSFNLVVITHGSAKFAVLRKRLETISGDDPDSSSEMTECIIRHQQAIEFADTLERLINILALAQFVISTGLICFAGFQIMSMMEDTGRLMKYSTFLNSAILELFMYSLSGDGLIEESENVGLSAYSCEWIKSRYCPNLMIMMMRSMIPNQITAAKFYSMSLQSFSTVLSTSFSYLTVLTATKEE
ncbi:odorant receptor 13a [Lasioglossum baleicum]|uniref:odorant receptor 13a n=1 Tax=Lasioglossum baleicum TaxID=434251 RepID=UPI003FCE0782